MGPENDRLADRPRVLEVNDVSFAYDTEPVLKNVSFHIHAREMAAFVGPNGGGKTTLLKLILGLLSPVSGGIRIFGSHPVKARRRLGYVPQYMQFDPQFPASVLDVVRMGRVERHACGPYGRDDNAAARNALEQVDLKGLEQRSFTGLSGGQRQRVLIARALVSAPELLLLDEPTANVDYMVEQKLYSLLKDLSEKMSVIIVSHDVGVVTKFVDTVVCVNRAVKLHPTSEFTGAHLQEMYGPDAVMIRHDHTCSEHGHEHECCSHGPLDGKAGEK